MTDIRCQARCTSIWGPYTRCSFRAQPASRFCRTHERVEARGTLQGICNRPCSQGACECFDNQDDESVQEAGRLQAEIARLRKALEEIAKGTGVYSRDPYEHACNCIENMKDIARTALEGGTDE